jgi:hypothetical protein
MWHGDAGEASDVCQKLDKRKISSGKGFMGGVGSVSSVAECVLNTTMKKEVCVFTV